MADTDTAKYEEEYEKAYGSGPFGICEIKLCTGFTCNPIVSIVSALVLWGFVIWVSVEPKESMEMLKDGQTWVTTCFTWLYIGSQDFWFFWLFPLAYYYGHVKLGRDDEEPEFSDLSYFSMVFCAGVAIGLIFYGASEPLWHYLGTHRYNDGYSNDNQKMQDALNITIFHWGLQAWVVYAMAAISMGLLSYRQGLPLCFRTTLAPLLGRAAWGWFGDLIDVVTIVTVVSGLCTSLGMGAKQAVGGMQRLGWLPHDMDQDEQTAAAVVTVVIVTCVATLSVVSGVNYGVKTLSQTAFVLGNFLLLSVFFMDSPWFLLNSITQSFGYHAQHFLEISFFTDAFAQLNKGEGAAPDGLGAASAWMDWWTIFYWGWWISWAPFVGTFLARISRGRTILNVIMYSMTVPFAYALVWFTTFGGAALRMHMRASFLKKVGLDFYGSADFFKVIPLGYRPSGAGDCFHVPATLPSLTQGSLNATALQTNWTSISTKYTTNPGLSPVCLFGSGDADGYWFDLMNQYHGFGTFLGVISIITIMLYFVTSSDSGSLVVDLIAANGREAHVVQRIFWALTEGAVAVALLQAGGAKALKALQALSIIMGLPFTVIMMLMVTATWRALKLDQGHLALRGQRMDFKMPLYGGVFDYIQFVHTLGRAPLPKGSNALNFVIGLFCPPLLMFQIYAKLSKREAAKTDAKFKPTRMSLFEDMFCVVVSGVTYLAFLVLHICTWANVNDGLAGIAWVMFIAFVTIVSVARYRVRKYYKIVGNPAEDFFSTLFVWPQVLAQCVEQVDLEYVDFTPPPQKEPSTMI